MKKIEQNTQINNAAFPGFHPFKSQKGKEMFLAANEKSSKLWPVPSTTCMVDTPYGKTFIRVSGPEDAPPLVLLHGISGSSLDWIPNIKALSKNFRTYAVDNIYGFGLSVYTKPVSTPDDFVNWLDGLFDGLKLGNNINLMGVSYGAWQAAMYVKRFPGRLNKIVLVAPIAVIAPVSPGFLMRMLLAMMPFESLFKSFMRWLWEDYITKDKNTAEQIMDIYLFNEKCFTPRRPPNPTLLTDDELKSIGVPALYVVGDNEKNCSVEKALERINRFAPLIKTALIPGAGHDLLFVQPELIHEKVLKFLT